MHSLEDVKDFNSFCNHLDSRSNVQRDIQHDEQIFNPKLIASLNISTEEEVHMLCERFVNRAIIYDTYLPIFGQMAKKIHSALQSNLGKDISFKDILINTITNRFENDPDEDEAETKRRMAIALYGEMYNIDWIKQATFNSVINALKELKNENFYIILLQSLLKSCSVKLSMHCAKDQMIALQNEMKKINKKEDKDGHMKYLIQDIVHLLTYIIGIREKSDLKAEIAEIEKKEIVPDLSKLTIDNLFKDMCEEAYMDVINDVKSKPIDNVEEFIEKLISKALSSCAHMVAKATRDICTTVYMREVLSNKCHSTFLDYVKDENKVGSTIRLLHYIGELYNLDVFSNDFISLCFDILFEHSGEIGTLGISALLRNVGSKMEVANIQKLESYFQFFDHIVSTEHSRRSREFKKLKSLRANDWSEQGIQHSYEDFLMLYTIENADAEEVIVKVNANHVEVEKFLFALWKTVLKDPHPSYAELCKKLTKFCPEFNHALVEFLKSRCNTFANLECQHYNEAVNCHLGKVLIFVSELYQLNVIPEHLFEIWLDPRLASKTPHCFILVVLSIISPKIDSLKNTRLKTLITNLEQINEDKSQQKWNSICGEMNELKEALKEYKAHHKH